MKGTLLVGGVAVGLLAGCGASAEEKAAESASNAALVREAMAATVRYAVTGDTDQASITMQTPTGSSQQNDIDVPLQSKSSGNQYLEFTFTAGDFVYLSAQNSQGYGSVTCAITTDDGDLISQNTASGGYAIATCKGTAR